MRTQVHTCRDNMGQNLIGGYSTTVRSRKAHLMCIKTYVPLHYMRTQEHTYRDNMGQNLIGGYSTTLRSRKAHLMCIKNLRSLTFKFAQVFDFYAVLSWHQYNVLLTGNILSNCYSSCAPMWDIVKKSAG